MLFCDQSLCYNDSERTFQSRIFWCLEKKQFIRQFFFSLLQVYIMYRVSFIFRQNAFLEFVCTNIKDSLFALLPRGRGIRLVCTRSSFHEFYFYGKRFYHHIYPHPRPHLHSHSRPTFSRPLFPTLRAESVSKCCGSWVWVWVWVNVVGKKKKN